jgi:predicted nucleotidyltransferase
MKIALGIFETYRRSYEEAYQKALTGAKFLYAHGAKKVFFFGSLTNPELFMRESDIDIAVEGLPEEKRFAVEAGLIDILYPYDFDFVVIDSNDIIVKEEVIEAVTKGLCIKKS